MAIKLSQARQICSKAEFELVQASQKKNLPDLSASQLKQKIARAKKLRDKWRDLATQQTRKTQAEKGARLQSGNERSGEKAELFGEVMGRFEKQLGRVEKDAGGSAARGRPPKKKRSEQHRAERAVVRRSLRDEQQSGAAQPASSTATPPAASPADTAGKQTPTRQGATKGTKKAVKKAARKGAKKKPTRRKRPATGQEAEPLTPPPTQAARGSAGESGQPKLRTQRNLAAQQAAKARRVQRSGAPRIHGHVSSRTKRNQARRDVGR